jgi:hypothetical protein
MITLVCTKCGNTLHVDDGFAGGVCRCSACGTIQTVPKRGQQQANGQQAIFERATRTSKDLEALSDIVTSSGLVGSGVMRHARKSSAAQLQEIEQRRKFTPIAIGLGALVAAVAVGLWVAFGMGGSAEKTDHTTNTATPTVIAPPTPSGPAPTVAIKGPAFGPIALDAAGTVIYLVDRGDATRAYTEPLQRAVAKSVSTLGASRKFQVRYWTADGESPAFPITPGDATPAALTKLNAWMADVPGGRATDATASLDDALAAKPAEIVILTGKAWQLDESFANEAIVKLGTTKVRIHGVALGGAGGSDALSRVSAKTGGRFVEMDEPTLARIGK